MNSILITNLGKARIAAGKGSVQALTEELRIAGIKRPLIVSDPGVAELESHRNAMQAFKQEGMIPVLFSGVTPNPKDHEVMTAAAMYKEEGCDAVVGIGGGSSMDAAKGAAVMARHEGDIMDYGRSTPGRKFFVNGREPLYLISTTTGTGSEVSPHAVITNTKKNNRKSDVMDRLFYCDMFALDPDFAGTQPLETMRDTGVDALSHMIDSYTNKKMLKTVSPLHEAMGLKCVELVSGNLRKMLATGGEDTDAVLAMQWAASFGGMMLDLDAALIHGISGALQKYRHEMTHGVSCGIIMPACMRYNLQTCPEKFAAIARAMGVNTAGMNDREAALASVQAVEELLDDIAFPKMRDFNYTGEELKEMAEISASNSMMKLNSRPVRCADDVLGIYLDAAEH